ncbi:transcriptional regulator [Devosia sp. J2-20]|uniref:transcriptional regulator n=1 Tax=Devosia sp. J2-20 TaxID=3026161 RepID=UPI00249C9137|nr:transcriptional regulator [Devosia sp. J2-20]WDR00721.1 transcriptional regulator [Devosia sp. J2-20]|tara:strand:- start:45230 stop:45652 length:423 start_codon:yes stop_codon:yes gene_type:complete
MNRGPQTGKARNGANDRSYMDKATEAFDGNPPEWIVALAARADLTGLDGAAEAIGYSGSLVSTVLRNIYKGDVGRVEEKVRGALLGLTVDCPVIGEMSRHTCLDWQGKPKAATSALRMRMYHACRNNCPHFRPKGGTDAE